jgi:uncharacterized protein (DUF2252 family)
MVHEGASGWVLDATLVVQYACLIAMRDGGSIIFSIMAAQSKQLSTREERRQAGRACRNKVSRVAQGKFDPMVRKFDPVALMKAAHEDRIPDLVPMKNARMAVSPFSFFRGAAPLMAADLAQLPHTGLKAQICGDAHVQNLGAFGGGPDGHLIFDINDFDETIRAPWEWDVKRMASSLILAGREARNSERQCKDAVLEFARSYRESMKFFSELPVVELARYLVMRKFEVGPIRSVLRKAERATPLENLKKLTLEKDGKYELKEVKDATFGVPTQYRVNAATAQMVLAALPGYGRSLLPGRSHFFAQYRPADVGFRIVGTGSVGTRDYVVLMFGGAVEDPMFLQLKQELPSAYAPYLPKNVPPAHHGQRVVEGVMRMLVQFDPFLGWTTIAGLPYLVRQLRDHKGSIETTDLEGKGLLQYAEVCGELLSKGHARSGDPCMLSGYLGTADRFDKALVNFAVDYADQGTRDFEAWLKAIRAGTVKAIKAAPATPKKQAKQAQKSSKTKKKMAKAKSAKKAS